MKNLSSFVGIWEKIRFDSPPKANMVVFDAESTDTLKKTVLKGFEYTVLYTRQEVFHLSLVITLLMLKNLSRPTFIRLMRSMSISGIVLMAYLYSCIEYIRPKVVVTFIDTDFHFQWISRNYKGPKFYTIQNGTKVDYDVSLALPASPHPAHKISLPDYICFGEYEKELYGKYGHTIDRFHPVGSLLGGYYKSEISEKGLKKEFDICLVSAWPVFMFASEHYYMEAKKGLAMFYEYFARYLDEYYDKDHLNICVATRTGEVGECDYFRKLYGDRVKLIMHNKENYSTYRAMDKSDVVIAFLTTPLREAFGWGKKVLACNLSHDGKYDFPVRGIWSVDRGNYEEFKEKLDNLRSMNTSEFMKRTSDQRKFLMNYIDDLPAHVYIRNILTESLK